MDDKIDIWEMMLLEKARKLELEYNTYLESLDDSVDTECPSSID
jgi:hypothetical protein